MRIRIVAVALDLDAVATQFRKHAVDAAFADDLDAFGAHLHAHKAVLCLDPEPLVVQVRVELSPRLVVGVRHVVAGHRLFSRHYTNLSHN